MESDYLLTKKVETEAELNGLYTIYDKTLSEGEIFDLFLTSQAMQLCHEFEVPFDEQNNVFLGCLKSVKETLINGNMTQVGISKNEENIIKAYLVERKYHIAETPKEYDARTKYHLPCISQDQYSALIGRILIINAVQYNRKNPYQM